MTLKIDRIISIATLLASLIAIVLVLKKPAPVAQPQSPAAIAANAQAFQQKIEQLEQSALPASRQSGSQSASAYSGSSVTSQSANQQFGNVQSGDPTSSAAFSNPPSSSAKPEVHVSSDEVSAALIQALGAGSGELAADSNIGSSAPAIKDQQVSFDGDTVHGQFLTEIAGKDVWVTVSGHLASKDGYATFEPTEFKVGDLNVPVSLVNPALQKKLSEQRDRLKLPDYMKDLKVENGELVMQPK